MLRLITKFLQWKPLRLAFVAPLILLTASQGIVRAPGAASLEFRVRLSQAAYDTIASMGLQTPINGRLFIIVTQDDSSEPRQQIDVTGVPFWGMDVFDLTPGTKHIAVNDRQEGMLGFPLAKFADLPEGEYTVQAFLTVYTKYQRSDGYTLLMHHETGEGQRQFRSPGNAYSQPMKVRLEKKWGKIYIDLTEVIPPIQPLLPGEVLDQGNPRDTAWVKFVKIRSEAASAFWGRDMYVGANILLPKGYDENPDLYYPVIYNQGHFPGANAPFGFREGNAFYNYWVADDTPRFIAVTFRDATPFYDTSYGVDSANVGPYGQAIVNELIPYIEFELPHHSRAVGVGGGGRLHRRLGSSGDESFLAQFLRRHMGLVPGWHRLQLPPDRQRVQRRERLLH